MANMYLLYGDEKYDLELKVQKIKKEFEHLEVGVNLFYLTNDNITQLSNVLQGVTFFGSEKLVIIKDTKLKWNISLLDDLAEDIIVVIIEDSVDKRTSEYKQLSKIAECIEFKHMDAREMVTYMVQLLKRYDMTISYEDAEYLQTICGEDKNNTINELQKLVLFLGSGHKVTREVIDAVCVKTLNAKIFDVLNCIVNKQKKEAFRSLDDILEQKEPIIKIAIMLYKQIKQMYLIKYLKQKNATDIATILSIHPFVFKNLNKSCDQYSLEHLKKLLYAFNTYDEKTKNGEMDFEIGLKEIICMM